MSAISALMSPTSCVAKLSVTRVDDVRGVGATLDTVDAGVGAASSDRLIDHAYLTEKADYTSSQPLPVSLVVSGQLAA
jgi:hypothetical protein